MLQNMEPVVLVGMDKLIQEERVNRMKPVIIKYVMEQHMEQVMVQRVITITEQPMHLKIVIVKQFGEDMTVVMVMIMIQIQDYLVG